LPLSKEDRLRMILEYAGIGIQDFLTRTGGRPWPARGAVMHVDIRDDEAVISWLVAQRRDPVISSLIDRRVLGV